MMHDEGEVDAVRASLSRIKSILNIAAYDYAKASLSAAQEALESSLAAAPCASVWAHISEYQRLSNKAQEAIDTCTTAIALLLKSEETGDLDIDRINASVKLDTMERHVIASLLEGASNRAQIALQTMPENPSPGARCIPDKVKTTNGPTDT